MTVETVPIGVAVPDVSDFADSEPAFGVGDQREQALSALDLLRRRGDLPDGVDLELRFRSFGAADTAGKREVADRFADDGVLAVVGARDFTYGAVRLAERHHVPVIDVNAVPSSLLARTAPWMFTLRAAQDLLYRAFVRWAHRERLVRDARLGVFDDRFTRESTRAAIEELRALGHDVAVHVSADGAGYGSDHDDVAAERFADAGVDAVLPFVSGSSLIQLLAALAGRGARPTVVDLETGEHTADVTAHFAPAEIYDGTRALTMNRVGEAASSTGLHPLSVEVLEAFEAYSGRHLERTGWRSSGELTNVFIVHDLLALLAAGLRAAASPLDRSSLVAGLESVGHLTLAGGGDARFAAGEHWAIRQARPVRWSATADRWEAVDDFEGLAAL